MALNNVQKARLTTLEQQASRTPEEDAEIVSLKQIEVKPV